MEVLLLQYFRAFPNVCMYVHTYLSQQRRVTIVRPWKWTVRLHAARMRNPTAADTRQVGGEFLVRGRPASSRGSPPPGPLPDVSLICSSARGCQAGWDVDRCAQRVIKCNVLFDARVLAPKRININPRDVFATIIQTTRTTSNTTCSINPLPPTVPALKTGSQDQYKPTRPFPSNHHTSHSFFLIWAISNNTTGLCPLNISPAQPSCGHARRATPPPLLPKPSRKVAEQLNAPVIDVSTCDIRYQIVFVSPRHLTAGRNAGLAQRPPFSLPRAEAMYTPSSPRRTRGNMVRLREAKSQPVSPPPRLCDCSAVGCGSGRGHTHTSELTLQRRSPPTNNVETRGGSAIASSRDG